MTQVESFEIHLEHDIDEQYQYEPGETLCGKVVITVRESAKVKAIQVQIKGEATVSWEEDDRAGKAFRADETYVEHTQTLLSALSGEMITLDKGLHEYPLEYTLPPNLPSSFIGKHGSITYVVKATLKQDARFGLSAMITSEPFLVLRRLSLDSDPTLTEPYEQRIEKRMWGAIAFCISGKVSAILKLNKTGHLPGEDVFLDAEITNTSPRVVKAVQATIIMHSVFNARNKKRSNSQIVNKKRDEWEMTYGEGRRWKNVRITIPPYIPESRLDSCDIIDISYELVFRVEVSGNKDLCMNVPIVVGTTGGLAEQAAAEKEKVWRASSFMMGPVEGETGGKSEDANANTDDQLPIDMNEEETGKFRRPMEPGETRTNPLFFNQ